MRSFLTAYVKGKKATLKYEFAIAAFAVWVAYLIRIALSGSPEWIAAQAVPFGTVTTTVWLYIGAVVGVQTWQNMQPSGEPSYESGDLPRPFDPQDGARAG